MADRRQSRHGRARSKGLSGWPLRRKVVLALAIPLLLAATLAGLRVSSDLAEASNSAASSKQVTVLRPAVDYLAAAEQATVAAQSSSSASAKDLDGALQQLRSSATRLSDTAEDADLTADQQEQVDALLDLSQAMRGDSDALSGSTWLAGLRQLQSGVSQLVSSIANAQMEPLPDLALLSQALDGRLSLAMQQALAATDRSGRTGSQELFSEIGVEGAAIDALASGLAGEQAATIAELRTANAERSRSVRTGKDDLGGVDAYAGYDSVVNGLLSDIDSQLSDAATDARTSALVNAGITAVALLAAILLALLISRLLLRPIRTVREGALTVAHEQLPEEVRRIRAGEKPGEIQPIAVETTEEIGQLARAVDDLHRQAVLLASGEAELRSQVGDMFVTLSRRTNSLINQQLAQIETLEKDEEDPQRLESIFRLDHLAARMRRTSDSLLILAGAPSRPGTQEAVTVSELMQAATAGVQDYQRVHVGAGSPMRVHGAAAADVIHLLTELVDNALTYSPPASIVSMTSTVTANGLKLEITDAGLGVPAESLGELNRLLHSGGDVTPDTARRMGLFVVSRLAQRHGIAVSLMRNENAGMTAAVTLPAAILAQPAAAEPRPAAPPAPLAAVPAPIHEPTAVRAPGLAAAFEPRRAESDGAPLPTGLPRRQPGTSPLPGMPAAEASPAPLPTRQDPLTAPVPAPEPIPLTVDLPTRVPRAAAPRTAGEIDSTAPFLPSSDEVETPIFRTLRSGWLSAEPTAGAWASTEVERGWQRADEVDAATPIAAVDGPIGLPVRRPGARLVPGGVTKPAAAAARDPEAVRARLAAHAAGVSRGRMAATEAGTVEDTTTKAGL